MTDFATGIPNIAVDIYTVAAADRDDGVWHKWAGQQLSPSQIRLSTVYSSTRVGEIGTVHRTAQTLGRCKRYSEQNDLSPELSRQSLFGG